MTNIHQSIERERGCGYRQKGGLYLKLDEFNGVACGKLPILFHSCECCGFAAKHSRSLSWLSVKYIHYLTETDGCAADSSQCRVCSFNALLKYDRVALDWVGKKAYSADSFSKEAARMGISRKISAKIDKTGKVVFPLEGFKVGVDLIALAHAEADVRRVVTPDGEEKFEKTAGIFKIYRPERLEYIVKGNESDAFIQKLTDQGVRCVNVIKDKDASSLNFEKEKSIK